MSLIDRCRKVSMKNPGRTSKTDLEQRIELTHRLLASRARKGDIKKTLIARWGVSARTAENYLARARERILADSQQPREQHRANAIAFYESIIGDMQASTRDRIKAQERMDRLLGLEAPTRHVHGGEQDLPPIQHSVSPVDIAAELRKNDDYVQWLRDRERHRTAERLRAYSQPGAMDDESPHRNN